METAPVTGKMHHLSEANRRRRAPREMQAVERARRAVLAASPGALEGKRLMACWRERVQSTAFLNTKLLGILLPPIQG